MLFANPFHLSFEATSYRENFVAHEVKANNSRKLHCFVKEASNRLFHVPSKLFERFAVSVDAVAQSTGGVAAIDLVFNNFKYDFRHTLKMEDFFALCKLAVVIFQLFEQRKEIGFIAVLSAALGTLALGVPTQQILLPLEIKLRDEQKGVSYGASLEASCR